MFVFPLCVGSIVWRKTCVSVWLGHTHTHIRHPTRREKKDETLFHSLSLWILTKQKLEMINPPPNAVEKSEPQKHTHTHLQGEGRFGCVTRARRRCRSFVVDEEFIIIRLPSQLLVLWNAIPNFE